MKMVKKFDIDKGNKEKAARDYPKGSMNIKKNDVKSDQKEAYDFLL